MKIRWTAGSLRFRFSPTELDRLRDGESLEESFSPAGWKATLSTGTVTELLTDGVAATVILGDDDFARLCEPEREGIYFQSASGIRCIVEKDYPCIHPRALESLELPTETFAEPAGFRARKETNPASAGHD